MENVRAYPILNSKYFDYWYPIFFKDDGGCFCCGNLYDIDRAHLTAVCYGGTGLIDNVVLLCRCCHRRLDSVYTGLPEEKEKQITYLLNFKKYQNKKSVDLINTIEKWILEKYTNFIFKIFCSTKATEFAIIMAGTKYYDRCTFNYYCWEFTVNHLKIYEFSKDINIVPNYRKPEKQEDPYDIQLRNLQHHYEWLQSQKHRWSEETTKSTFISIENRIEKIKQEKEKCK